jgi:glycosyltransferase involved in cell wall biosynthesis
VTPDPLVSALMVVYNGERFIAEALASALDQDYANLEIVVVDDGSTDGTAALVERIAAAHPGRLRLVRQRNAGNCGATSRAIAEARGELLAIIDADDVWPRTKLSRQVEAMAQRPKVGLLYGDMTVIDADGDVIQPSWLDGDPPYEGDRVGPLLPYNNVTASSVMLRTSVAREITPIPAELPFADWYLAVATVEAGYEVGYLPLPRTLYRYHQQNMSLGAKGPLRHRELCKALRFQRWALRRLRPGQLSPQEIALVWKAFERNAREAASESPNPFMPLVDITDVDRGRAIELAGTGDRALARGYAVVALNAFLMAAAADPGLERAREGLQVALTVVPDGAVADPAHPDPLAGAAELKVLADVYELIDNPQLLVAYAEAMRDVPAATLVIDAGELELERLQALVADTHVPDSVDLLAVRGPLDRFARARLSCGISARLSERDDRRHLAPRFGAADVRALRRRATAAA